MADQTNPAAPEAQSAPVAAPVSSQAPAAAPEEDEKFFAALGYFGFLFVAPLIVKPKSAYCRFHARQSMVLFLVFFLALIVLATFHMIGSLIMLVLFALYVIAIYRAYRGDLWNIPVISTFAGKMNLESLYSKAGLAVSGISGLKEKAAGLAEKAGEAAKSLGAQEEKKEENQPPPQV